jgi:hypothetical protein
MENTNQIEKEINSLQSLRTKTLKELDTEKLKLAEIIKGLNKEDLFPKPKKMTLWNRIMKVLNF